MALYYLEYEKTNIDLLCTIANFSNIKENIVQSAGSASPYENMSTPLLKLLEGEVTTEYLTRVLSFRNKGDFLSSGDKAISTIFMKPNFNELYRVLFPFIKLNRNRVLIHLFEEFKKQNLSVAWIEKKIIRIFNRVKFNIEYTNYEDCILLEIMQFCPAPSTFILLLRLGFRFPKAIKTNTAEHIEELRYNNRDIFNGIIQYSDLSGRRSEETKDMVGPCINSCYDSNEFLYYLLAKKATAEEFNIFLNAGLKIEHRCQSDDFIYDICKKFAQANDPKEVGYYKELMLVLANYHKKLDLKLIGIEVAAMILIYQFETEKMVTELDQNLPKALQEVCYKYLFQKSNDLTMLFNPQDLFKIQCHIHAKGVEAYKEGDFRRAEGLFSNSILINPTISSLYSRANCYEKLDQIDNAKADYQACLKLDPTHQKSKDKLSTHMREEAPQAASHAQNVQQSRQNLATHQL